MITLCLGSRPDVELPYQKFGPGRRLANCHVAAYQASLNYLAQKAQKKKKKTDGGQEEEAEEEEEEREKPMEDVAEQERDGAAGEHQRSVAISDLG